MPLLKLWNSIRSVGKQGQKSAADQAEAADTPTLARATATTEAPTRSGRPAQTSPTAKKPKRLGGLLRGGPHAGLIRQLKSLKIQSILEIGVGDGTRALAVIESLQKHKSDLQLHYVAVDQFEMAGGIPLRDFHKQLRAASVQANLIPMPVPAGLDRVARTFGQMDLVLCSDADFQFDEAPMSRLCKPNGTVFHCIDGQWSDVNASIAHFKAA